MKIIVYKQKKTIMKIMSILYSIAYTIQKRTLQTVVKISFSTISTLLNRPKKWGKKNGTLRVCLDRTYFAETENLLLKSL